MSCTCKDSKQMKTVICFNKECKISFDVEKSQREKIITCPEHSKTTRPVNGAELRLCEKCASVYSIKEYKIVKA